MKLGWKLPLERLSATSLATAIQCPEQFRQKYIVRDRDSDVMFGARFVGLVDHKVNEAIMRHLKTLLPEERTCAPDNMIEKIYKEQWDEAISRNGEPDWRGDDPLKMMESGIKMAKAYHRQVYVKPVALEQRFEISVPGVPVPISGYIDVIEENKIRERKTSAVKRTKPKPSWRFQGQIYQLAAGLPVQWDVITRQVTPQVFTAEAWPDLWLGPQDARTTQRMIYDTARRINDLYSSYGPDEYWPTTGVFGDWLCDYCVVGPKYEGTCPAWRMSTI